MENNYVNKCGSWHSLFHLSVTPSFSSLQLLYYSLRTKANLPTQTTLLGKATLLVMSFFPLLSLPAEILHIIASILTARDIKRLQLVNTTLDSIAPKYSQKALRNSHPSFVIPCSRNASERSSSVPVPVNSKP